MKQEVPGPHALANFHRFGFKMWAYSTQNRENGNFWYKFAHKGKFWGSTEKFKHRRTTTNFPLCSDSIIVLKIILHHSVSVVISKRDKNRQKTSQFFVYSWRATHDPHHIWHDDREGPCNFCTP